MIFASDVLIKNSVQDVPERSSPLPFSKYIVLETKRDLSYLHQTNEEFIVFEYKKHDYLLSYLESWFHIKYVSVHV